MRYWKILKEGETHNDFKYKYGWNEDVLPFNSLNRECVEGGLYFANSKNILGFLDYGTLVREVLDWDKEKCVMFDDKIRSKKIKLGRRSKITINWLKEIIKDGANIHAKDDYVFRWAAENNHLEIVEFLYEKGTNIHAKDDYAFRLAAENNHIKIVKFLYEKGANIHAWNDGAFRWAADNNHLDVVEFLYEKGADIHAWNDYAFRWAADNGNLEIVEFLYNKGANIHVWNDEALRSAKKKSHAKVVKFLEKVMKKERRSNGNKVN